MSVVSLKSISGITSITNAAGSSDLLTFHSNNTTERFRIGSAGQLGLGGANYGSSGQVLTSAGGSAVPTWTTISSGPATGDTYVKLRSTSGASASGSNTFAGSGAGVALNGSSGDHNSFYGRSAGAANDGGQNNTFLGSNAGVSNVSGHENVAIGQAAYENGTGGKNIAIGRRALQATTSSDSSVGIGYEALKTQTNGGQSVAIGHEAAMTVETGSQNVAIGHNALKLGTASHNTIVGAFAGDAITSGEGNVALGRAALGALQGGHNNIAIGRGAAASSTSVSNEVTIGDTSITKFRIPGINFELADNGGTPSNGTVLTMASGGATWAAAGGGGKILQVVQEHRTDVWSESVAQGAKSGAAITKAITTSASNSKVLVTLSLTVGWSDQTGRSGVTLKRGGTEIALSDSTGDNKTRLLTCTEYNGAHWCEPLVFTYLDSPGSAATHTYTAHLWHGYQSTFTAYLNRAGVESNDNWRGRGTSSIVLMEVSA